MQASIDFGPEPPTVIWWEEARSIKFESWLQLSTFMYDGQLFMPRLHFTPEMLKRMYADPYERRPVPARTPIQIHVRSVLA